MEHTQPFKDKRYLTVKRLIESGHVQSFNQIFDHVPKSVIAEHLGFNNERINKLIKDLRGYNLYHIFQIAELIQIDELILLQLVYQQNLLDRKKHHYSHTPSQQHTTVR